MCWALRFDFWNGHGPGRCFLSAFGNNAGKNLATFCLRCIIAHKTLFSPSFHRENTAVGMPHFHSENPIEFRVWCAIAHR